MGDRYDPFEHAEVMGITVEYHRNLPEEYNGMWFPDDKTILLRPGMTRVLERSVLAHELGHAAYMHPCGEPKYERQAHRFAIKLLLDTDLALQVWNMREVDDANAAELLEIDYELFHVFKKDMDELHWNSGETEFAMDIAVLAGKWADGYYLPDF